MKLEAQVKVCDNKLYFLDDSEFSTKDYISFNEADLKSINLDSIDNTKLYALNIKWETIGKDEDSYNEEFLAELRNILKSFEEKKIFCFVNPIFEDAFNEENLIASFKHCARRIKDCESVLGFNIPEQISKETFIEEMYPKHKHYVYFSKNSDVLNDKNIVSLN